MAIAMVIAMVIDIITTVLSIFIIIGRPIVLRVREKLERTLIIAQFIVN
jgi:hypothetical protein